jgi:transposase
MLDVWRTVLYKGGMPPKPQPISEPTARALKLVAKGWTAYAAAKKQGIALSTIYRALRRERNSRQTP